MTDLVIWPYDVLDPDRLLRDIEAQTGQTIFDAASRLDPELARRQMQDVLGISISNEAMLDPARLATDLVAALADTGGGGGGGYYTTGAVAFHGREAFFTNALEGANSSSVGTFFCWHKSSDTGGSSLSIITSALDVGGDKPAGNTPINFYQSAPGFPTNNTTPFVVQLEANPWSGGHFGVAPDVDINDGSWRLTACSWDTNHDTGQKTCQVLFGTEIQTFITWEDSGPFSPEWGPGFVVGAYTWTGSGFDESWIGDLSDLFLDITTAVDLSDPAVVAKIIYAGKPINQGSDGSLLTGSQPILYCRGDKTTYGSNLGYGGAFTLYDERQWFFYPDVVGPASYAQLSGALAEMTVALVHDNTNDVDVTSEFESIISVNGAISQTSSTDFTAIELIATVHTLTNATTSPSD